MGKLDLHRPLLLAAVRCGWQQTVWLVHSGTQPLTTDAVLAASAGPSPPARSVGSQPGSWPLPQRGESEAAPCTGFWKERVSPRQPGAAVLPQALTAVRQRGGVQPIVRAHARSRTGAPCDSRPSYACAAAHSAYTVSPGSSRVRPSSPGCSGPARKSYVAYLDGDTSGQSVEDWQRSASSFELPLGELAPPCVPVCGLSSPPPCSAVSAPLPWRSRPLSACSSCKSPPQHVTLLPRPAPRAAASQTGRSLTPEEVRVAQQQARLQARLNERHVSLSPGE